MKQVSLKTKYMEEIIWYLLLFGTGMVFLLFFSVSTSPLTYNSYCTDSAFFQMCGRSMVQGKVMYHDIFDHKGPYLFFLQYLGHCFSHSGRYGIFCLQCVNMSVTLFLMDRGCKIVCKQKEWPCRIGSALIFFFLAEFTIDCGNLSEEYSLSFLFLCLLLFFKFIQHSNARRAVFYSMAMGVSFGVLTFMRITNAGFIGILIMVLSMELLLNRQFRFLILGITGFLAGFFCACFPVCIYYLYKGALADMLYATFGFNLMYAARSSGTLRYGVIVVLIITALTGAWLSRHERVYLLFAILSMVGTVFILLPGNAFIHYYQLIIPPVLSNAWLVMRNLDTTPLYRKKVYLGIAVILMILVNSPLILMHGGRMVVALGLNTPETEASALGRLAHSIEGLDPFGQGTYGYTAMEQIQDIMYRIPSCEYDSVFNYNTAPQWLCASGLSPYIKYCTNQESFILLCPEIENEIDESLENDPPGYIVLEKYDSIKNKKMLKRLESEYYCVYQNDKYSLYQLQTK